MRRSALITASVAVAVGVAGCGTSTVSSSEVANRAKAAFNQQLVAAGRSARILTVSCPTDLDAKVGASEVCSGSGTGGAKLNIRATVTSIKGSTAEMHFSISQSSGTTTSNTTT